MGEFYVADIATLNQIKKAWIFNQKTDFAACGYNYRIYLTKNGVTLKTVSVNLNCNILETEDDVLYFDTRKLAMLKGRVLKFRRQTDSFGSRREGKKFLDKIKNNKNVLWISTENWMTYEGKFSFDYHDSNPNHEYSNDTKEQLEALIKKTYPDEPFLLDETARGSGGDFQFELSCSKALYEKFNLVKKENNWQLFPVSVITCWK